MMNQMKGNKGFTLVELLVVIAIISILTIVTVSQFSTARQRARDAQRKGDLNNLAKALQMYYTDLGKFPFDTAGVGTTEPYIRDLLENGGEFKDGDYIYMKVVPQEKKLGTDFCYQTDAGRTKFGLYANLEVTSDGDCNDAAGNPNAYICNGNTYCFGLTSPNTKLNTDGSLN